MPNQQKYRPISFRPPEADRLWLMQQHEQTGQPVNAILAEALAEYRERRSLDPIVACRSAPRRCEAPVSCSKFGRCPLDYLATQTGPEES